MEPEEPWRNAGGTEAPPDRNRGGAEGGGCGTGDWYGTVLAREVLAWKKTGQEHGRQKARCAVRVGKIWYGTFWYGRFLYGRYWEGAHNAVGIDAGSADGADENETILQRRQSGQGQMR